VLLSTAEFLFCSEQTRRREKCGKWKKMITKKRKTQQEAEKKLKTKKRTKKMKKKTKEEELKKEAENTIRIKPTGRHTNEWVESREAFRGWFNLPEP